MRSIPFGYRIENGVAVVDETEASLLRQAFEKYQAGATLRSIAKDLDIDRYHRGISNMLADKKYLGTDFYPAIIEPELFWEVQHCRKERRTARSKPTRDHNGTRICTTFRMKTADNVPSEPFARAQYLYTLIELKEE